MKISRYINLPQLSHKHIENFSIPINKAETDSVIKTLQTHKCTRLYAFPAEFHPNFEKLKFFSNY